MSRPPLPAASAGTANATITAAKAIATLVDMGIFSSCGKHIAFADWIAKGGAYFPVCDEMGFSRFASAHSCAADTDRFTSILIVRCRVGLAALNKNAPAIMSHGVQADPTSREDGRLSAGHLPMWQR
jgi:hypothetical protein